MNLSKVNIWIDSILIDHESKLSAVSHKRLELLKNEVNKSNRLEKLVSQPSEITCELDKLIEFVFREGENWGVAYGGWFTPTEEKQKEQLQIILLQTKEKFKLK